MTKDEIISVIHKAGFNRPTTHQDKAMTKHPEATPQNLYQITGNVADINTVMIEREELRRLQAENDGVQALIAVHQRTLERCLELKAKFGELEAQLYTVGAGGVVEEESSFNREVMKEFKHKVDEGLKEKLNSDREELK